MMSRMTGVCDIDGGFSKKAIEYRCTDRAGCACVFRNLRYQLLIKAHRYVAAAGSGQAAS